MTRLEAATRWREKFPDRAGDLRTVMRRYLGMTLHDATASQFARTTLDVAEAELLGIVYGLPRDPEPEAEPHTVAVPAPVPSSGERPPTHPPTQDRFSGRDAAAGVERE